MFPTFVLPHFLRCSVVIMILATFGARYYELSISARKCIRFSTDDFSVFKYQLCLKTLVNDRICTINII